jgi:hypothetical protein
MSIVIQKRIREDAEQFLRTLDVAFSRRTAMAQQGGIQRIAMRPSTTAEKVSLLSRAYALSLAYDHDTDLVRLLIRNRRSTTTNVAGARLFLEALCHLEGPQAQKTYSRWAKAIAYLRSLKTLPSQVEALSKQKGEGINKWTRGGASKLNTSPATDLEEPVVVTMTQGSKPRHWQLYNSQQVRAVEQALRNIKPQPIPTTKRRKISKPAP